LTFFDNARRRAMTAFLLIFTLAVTGIVFAIGAMSRRYVRGVDAA